MANHYYNLRNLLLFISGLLILVPSATVLADCNPCEPEDDSGNNRSEALKYKIGAIVSILASSLIGVCIPILGKRIPSLKPETDLFFIIKAFAAGVILATGFMHVLPDAFENLTSPCLDKHGPWTDFPFAGFFAMVAAILTLVVDVSATSHYKKKQLVVGEVAAAGGGDDDDDVENVAVSSTNGSVHLHHTHGHAQGDFLSTKLRYRVISQVLELGIIVHSVIIGIALGASDSPKTIKPLVAALTFHQFFEGIGLGGCITQAKFKSRAVIIMALFFALTTPVGIGIGIGLAESYKETDRTALIVQGTLNSASAGILIYMALVDLLSADFMHPKMQSNGKLQVGSNISLLLGAGFMSLLAYWA